MTKIGLLSCLFLISSLYASDSDILKSYDRLFELSQNERGYSLKSNDFAMHFPRHQVSKPIRDLRGDQLAALLKSNAYYLKATQLSDGTHALDLQGRLQGGAWGDGGLFGYVVGKVLVPGAILVPSYVIVYTGKAILHVKCGPEKAAAFGESANQYFLPWAHDIAFRAGDAVAPVAGAVGAVVGGTGPQ